MLSGQDTMVTLAKSNLMHTLIISYTSLTLVSLSMPSKYLKRSAGENTQMCIELSILEMEML